MAGASSDDDTKEMSDEEEKLKSRHRQEIKELRAKIQGLKKSVPKGDKKWKKDVTAQIAQLEQEIKERHEAELDDYNKRCSSDHHQPTSDQNNHQPLQQQEEEDTSVAAKASTKSRRKKEKREKKRREFEERISKEPDPNEPNAASIETEQLLSQLKLVGLQIKDVSPDGHCMFAAVSDQILQRDGMRVEVKLLRSQCADYIQQHHKELMPFLLDPETGDTFSDDKFAEYLMELKDTALWGGQLELRALSHIHQTQLHVYQANCPVLTIGEEYKDTKPLCLVYHKHLYGLGEHYNSTRPIIT